MPVFELPRQHDFPPPQMARKDGLLAIGGDLSPDRLVRAYARGIFPWYDAQTPILWWSPDPRMILLPDELHVSRSLVKVLKRNTFEVTLDRDFDAVITACATRPRPGQDGTWLVDEMREAYCELHKLGLAHSVEAWQKNNLVGGLYGVSLGRAFFGESMFYEVPDASKVAFVCLMQKLHQWGFELVDCQVETEHLARFGAREIPREDFLHRLERALAADTFQGCWSM